MTIKEFNLLQIEVYDGEKIIYSGISNDVPEELKERQIKIDKMDGKILKIKLV